MYETLEIRTMQEVRELFPNGIADNRNWIFVGTGGVHGSTSSIEDCEYILRGEDQFVEPLPNGKTLITVLIAHPHKCVLRWGEVQVSMDDLNYLRKLVRSTIDSVITSQEANV